MHLTFSRAAAPITHRPGMDPGTVYNKQPHATRGRLLDNRNVAGFVGCYRGDIRFFGATEEIENADGTSVIIANLGNSLRRADIVPVTLGVQNTLADVISRFSPREGGTGFDIPVGPEQSGEEQDPNEPDATIVTRYFFGQIGKILLVPQGSDIVEGPITNNDVQLALIRLPLGAYYVEAINASRDGIAGADPTALPAPKNGDQFTDSFELQLEVLAPSPNPIDSNSYYAMVQERSSALRAAALTVQRNQQEEGSPPEENESEGSNPSQPTTSRRDKRTTINHYHYGPRGEQGDDDRTMKTTQARSVFENMEIFLRIVGCRFGKVTADDGSEKFEVILGTLSEDVRDIFVNSPSSQWGEMFRSSLESHINELKTEHNDYIYQVVECPHFGDYVVKLLSRNKWKSSGTDVDLDSIDQSLSALMFCPPPDPEDLESGYSQYVQGTRLNETEEALEEAATNRAKKVARLFTNGRLQTMEDLVSTFANAIVFFSWLFDFDKSKFAEEAPHLAVCAHELANLLKESDSRQWGRRCVKHAPSGLLKILEQYQSVWRLMVRVAQSTTIRNMVKNDTADLPFAKFEAIIRRHDKVLHELGNAINDGGLNSYRDPTPLWLHRNKKRSAPVSPEQPAAKKPSSPYKPASPEPTPQQHIGWIKVLTPGYNFQWPPGLQTRICRHFACSDRTCHFGNACHEAHVTPAHLQPWERDTINAMLAADPNLELIPPPSRRRPASRPPYQSGGRGGGRGYSPGGRGYNTGGRGYQRPYRSPNQGFATQGGQHQGGQSGFYQHHGNNQQWPANPQQQGPFNPSPSGPGGHGGNNHAPPPPPGPPPQGRQNNQTAGPQQPSCPPRAGGQ